MMMTVDNRFGKLIVMHRFVSRSVGCLCSSLEGEDCSGFPQEELEPYSVRRLVSENRYC